MVERIYDVCIALDIRFSDVFLEIRFPTRLRLADILHFKLGKKRLRISSDDTTLRGSLMAKVKERVAHLDGQMN